MWREVTSWAIRTAVPPAPLASVLTQLKVLEYWGLEERIRKCVSPSYSWSGFKSASALSNSTSPACCLNLVVGQGLCMALSWWMKMPHTGWLYLLGFIEPGHLHESSSQGTNIHRNICKTEKRQQGQTNHNIREGPQWTEKVNNATHFFIHSVLKHKLIKQSTRVGMG